jgi:hypothetical protein
LKPLELTFEKPDMGVDGALALRFVRSGVVTISRPGIAPSVEFTRDVGWHVGNGRTNALWVNPRNDVGPSRVVAIGLTLCRPERMRQRLAMVLSKCP